MRNIFLFLIINTLCLSAFAQSGTISDFAIKSQYLTNGELDFCPQEQKSIQFDVTFVRYVSTNGQFLNPYYRLSLFAVSGGNTVILTSPVEVNKNGNEFSGNNNILTKTISVVVKQQDIPANASDIGLMYTVDNGSQIPFQDQYYEWQIACVYWNIAKTATFTKSCGPGTQGTSHSYTIPAHTYSAATQQAADALAESALQTQGQANANNNGTCYALTFPITGALSLCNGSATYSVELLPGTSVTWSTSSDITITSYPASNSVLVSKTGAGISTITANVVHQGVTITSNLTVGSSAPNPVTNLTGVIEPSVGQIHCSAEGGTGVTSYKWYLNGVYKVTTTVPEAGFNIGKDNCGKSYLVQVEAVNGCGSSANRSINFVSDDCDEWGK